jgi:hypothetical protein
MAFYIQLRLKVAIHPSRDFASLPKFLDARLSLSLSSAWIQHGSKVRRNNPTEQQRTRSIARSSANVVCMSVIDRQAAAGQISVSK